MRFSTSTKKQVILWSALLLPLLSQAQTLTNYIVNTANAGGPGQSNTSVGPSAGGSSNGGSSNSFFGAQAGASNTFGGANTFVGGGAGSRNTLGYSNTFMGGTAGNSNVDGNNNTYIGYASGGSNTSGLQNTFVGANSGAFTTASANTFVGYQAGARTSTGTFNTFIGVAAGVNNNTGSSNLILGTNAGSNNTSGSANFFVGDNAGGNNTTGSYNVYLGTNAGNGPNVNGDNNLAIGFEAGKTNIYGANNTFIGFRADAGASFLLNATAIGNNAKVNISDALILGNRANVGIGTSSPTAKLEVVSGSSGVSGLKLSSITSSFSPTSSASKFLTVDGAGNVILANYVSGGRQTASESLWQRIGSSLQNSQSESVIIGQNIAQTPAGYKLYVEQGILTERIKVAVKNTAEWSDYVFKPGYKLTPLAQVEQQIQQTGHLPGVLSAQQMVEQGNDLHKTDAKLLEKIEELTLYSIQLEKQNQELQRKQQTDSQKQQAEIDELKALVRQLLEKK